MEAFVGDAFEVGPHATVFPGVAKGVVIDEEVVDADEAQCPVLGGEV